MRASTARIMWNTTDHAFFTIWCSSTRFITSAHDAGKENDVVILDNCANSCWNAMSQPVSSSTGVVVVVVQRRLLEDASMYEGPLCSQATATCYWRALWLTQVGEPLCTRGGLIVVKWPSCASRWRSFTSTVNKLLSDWIGGTWQLSVGLKWPSCEFYMRSLSFGATNNLGSDWS